VHLFMPGFWRGLDRNHREYHSWRAIDAFQWEKLSIRWMKCANRKKVKKMITTLFVLDYRLFIGQQSNLIYPSIYQLIKKHSAQIKHYTNFSQSNIFYWIIDTIESTADKFCTFAYKYFRGMTNQLCLGYVAYFGFGNCWSCTNAELRFYNV
jgi:hypothetical protein